MSLPNSYTVKYKSLHEYFDKMLKAQPPERFTNKFLESLDFKSTNDRLFINILKEMGFVNAEGKPTQKYFDFLDEENSKAIIAEGIKQMYSDLFAINKEAHTYDLKTVIGKLKSLYAGSKNENTIKYIANTFIELVKCADFTKSESKPQSDSSENNLKQIRPTENNGSENPDETLKKLKFTNLQYQINIVLPVSTDISVYDVIFKALKNHLG